MNSYEIEKLLELKNNLVTLNEYIKICNSPQINHILYKDDIFHIWTNDNFKFELKIQKL
jgi:hypothetical protein